MFTVHAAVIALVMLLLWLPAVLRIVPLGPAWSPRLAEPFRFDGPLLKSVFSGPPKPKKAPAFTPPPVMPTVDDEAVKRAQRRAVAEQQARSGRLSTVLTDTGGDQTLG
jgi:hypothetical protein